MFLDAQERAFAIGIWVASFSAGAVVGPVFGGFISAHFWWGAVFLINVPVMLMLLILGPMLLPEFRDPNAGRMDLVSAGQSVIAVLGVIYGIKRLAEDGWALLPFVSIRSASRLAVIFFRRERRLADPLIDVRLFSAPAFSAALATNVLGLFMVLGSFLFITQYLQLVLRMGPLRGRAVDGAVRHRVRLGLDGGAGPGAPLPAVARASPSGCCCRRLALRR